MSDMPLSVESKFPIAEPKKITEEYMHAVVKDVIKEVREQRLSLTANAIVESANVATLSRLKNLVPEKARHVLRLSVKKVALTAGSLYLLISSACGNVENPSITPTNTPEPTPSSSPLPSSTSFPETPTLTPTPTATPKPTRTPTTIPTPTPEQTPTLTPEPTPTPIPPPTKMPTETPKPTSTETPDVKEYDYRTTFYGVTIAYDRKDGLPLKYVLPSGKEVFLDLDKERVKQLKDKAITNQEPEIIEVIVADWNVLETEGWTTPKLEKIKYSSEHPKTSELPDDIISEEELKARGIEIVQADNTRLYIRSGAFEEGEPLADFTENGNSSLRIILINAPKIANYFIKDARYRVGMEEGTWGDRKSIEKLTKDRIGILEDQLSLKSLDNLRKAIQDSDSSISEEELESRVKDSMIEAKGEIAALRTMPFDLLADYIVGLKFPRGKYDTSGNSAIIMLAVGERKVKGLFFLYVDHKGEFGLTRNGYVPPYYSPMPKESHTHPNPADFTKELEPSAESIWKPHTYAYGAQTSGLMVRHELTHDELIRQREKNNQEVNKSEWDTDIRAMEGIAQAWEKWEKSGFTDNSGYYFVFSLPKGGYILTKNKSSGSSAPSNL